MLIRLIASDMDHTLLTGRGELPPGFHEVVARLNAATRAALMDPGVRARLDAADLEPLFSTAAELRARLEEESRVWGDFIRARGLRLE